MKRDMFLRKIVSTIAIYTLLTSSLFCATKIWTGNNNTNWNAQANWVGGIPANNDIVVIDLTNYTGGKFHPTINISPFNPSDVIVRNRSVLTIINNLTTSGTITIDGGTLNMTSSTLNMSGVAKQLIISNSGTFNFSGGTINTSNDLQVLLGGKFNVSGFASLNIAGKLQIQDKNAFSNSSFNIFGGNVSVNGIIELDGAGTVSFPSLNISGGSLIANNKIDWKGGSSDRPNITITEGTITAFGPISSYSTSSNMSINIIGGTLNLRNNFTSENRIDSIFQTGGLIQFDGISTFTMNGIFSAISGDILFNGSTTLNSVPGFTFSSLTINDGKTLSSGISTNINILKNWTNNGVFISSTGKITFNGNSLQTITNANNNETFYDLEFNSSLPIIPQISSNTNLNIKNELIMKSGVVNLNSNTISIGTSATSTGSINHISGWFLGGVVKRWYSTNTIADGDSAGLFPLGNNTFERPLYITNPNVKPTTGGTFSATHIPSSTTQDLTIPDDLPILRIQNSEWNISSTSISDGLYNLRMGGPSFGVVGDINDLRITKIASTVGSPGINGGSVSNPEVNRINAPISDLTGGFFIGTINISNSPLPVKLLRFDAKQTGNKVKLEWATASELNNDFFTIEKSQDLKIFETVITVKGAGTSNEVKEYIAYDEVIEKGIFYYRLKQTDFNGDSEYSELVKVEINIIYDSFSFDIMPNPIIPDNELMIHFYGSNGKQVTVKIIDLIGKECYTNNFIVDGEDQLFKINPIEVFSAGVYLVTGVSDNISFSKKLVVR